MDFITAVTVQNCRFGMFLNTLSAFLFDIFSLKIFFYKREHLSCICNNVSCFALSLGCLYPYGKSLPSYIHFNLSQEHQSLSTEIKLLLFLVLYWCKKCYVKHVDMLPESEWCIWGLTLKIQKRLWGTKQGPCIAWQGMKSPQETWDW